MSLDSTSSSKGGTAPGLTSDPTAVANGAELSAGVMVGEYRVEGQLGSGPSGRVHSAVHAVVSRRAAIKVLHPEVASTREVVEKFFAEARAANALGHPNVVDVFAFGKLADGRNYIVMEALRGESLRERAKRTRMPLAEGLAIISTTTLALAAAHDKGIVHRNLKPENIFLVEVKGERPQVKLLDFGTAELLGPRPEDRKGSALLYLSPEQARGETPDPRTDVYALGAIAFELICGSPVFEAKTTAELLEKHIKEKPRAASALNSEVPAQLDALIAAMLSKTPAERPSLEKIRSELRACRLLVGGALTPPAGVPIVPAADGAAPAADAKTSAKKDVKKDAKKDAKADAKTDAKADAQKDAKPAPKAEAKETADRAPATTAVRPDAPTSKGGGIVAIVLLVAATIGIGIWVYMNQRNAPVDAGPPAPAAAPEPASTAPAATGSAAPAVAPTTPTTPTPETPTSPTTQTPTDPAQPAPGAGASGATAPAAAPATGSGDSPVATPAPGSGDAPAAAPTGGSGAAPARKQRRRPPTPPAETAPAATEPATPEPATTTASPPSPEPTP